VNDLSLLPDRLRLACLQFDVRRADVAGNCERVSSLMQEAAVRACHLVVLPEMWSASFAGEGLKREAECLAERQAFVAAEARRNQLWIAAGTLPEPASDDRVFNTLFLFDPTGTIRWSYRKVHLFPNSSEPRWFRGADRPAQPLMLGSWVIGGGVCYDVRMPELFRAQMKAQANLYVLPAQFPDPRLEHFTLLCRCRALENLAYLAGVNRIGSEGSLTHSGGSLVVDPFGRVLAQRDATEGIVIADLDVAVVQAIRRQHPFLEQTKTLDQLLAGGTLAHE